jgi:nicotinamidase-related amidase
MDKTDNAALLVMDVQPGIVQRVEQPDEYLEKLRVAVAAARERHIPVIFVVVGFRPGFPEVGPRNKSFAALRQTAPPAMVNPLPEITPGDGDIVVVKRRVSAFTGSDLEVILRARDIRHLVMAGIATSGVVLSTVREAADKDFRITVLSDLCADFDEEVHAVLMEKVFPRQADVVTASQWITAEEETASDA